MARETLHVRCVGYGGDSDDRKVLCWERIGETRMPVIFKLSDYAAVDFRPIPDMHFDLTIEDGKIVGISNVEMPEKKEIPIAPPDWVPPKGGRE